MRCIGQLVGVFALLSCGLLRAELASPLASDNPYAPIVDRNIFSLVPIPIPPPPDTKPPEPPAKITPNGIMSLFGQLQALFKVASPTKPGQPAQDKSYTLSVGERQDDIEVTKIDEAARVITFNNHGVVQELSLTNATVASTAAPVGGPSGASGFVRQSGPSSLANRFGGHLGQAGNTGGVSAPPNSGGMPSLGGNSNNNSESAITPEAAAVMMEVQRQQWKNEGNPALPLIPPPLGGPAHGNVPTP